MNRAAMYDTLLVEESEVVAESFGQGATILENQGIMLAIGDYDPEGFTIARTMALTGQEHDMLESQGYLWDGECSCYQFFPKSNKIS